MPQLFSGAGELLLVRVPGGATVTTAVLQWDLVGRLLRDVWEPVLTLLVDDSSLCALVDLVLEAECFAGRRAVTPCPGC